MTPTDMPAATLQQGINTTALSKNYYLATLDGAGKYTSLQGSQFSLPIGLDTFKLAIDRTLLPDVKEDVLECRADISFDGGKTWRHFISFRTTGELILDKKGNPVTTSSVTFGIPEPQNPNRLLKTSLTPLQNLTTDVSVTCT